MKLVSFQAAGKLGFGVVDGEQIVDLSTADKRLHSLESSPRDMLELIEAGPSGLDWALSALQASKATAHHQRFSLDEVSLMPPVVRPSKICCIALNNSANKDRIIRGPETPAMFVKPSSALLGHKGAIECRPAYGRTHPEPELALVIGKKAKNILAEHAYDYVFGYTIHNDITSPTMREEDTFQYRAIHPKADNPNDIEYVDTWVSYPGRYKCTDTFSCMGPWLVTKDEIPDPHNLDVSCIHQGELVAHDNTRNLTHKIPQLLQFLSEYLTLFPGDVVSLGTALQKTTTGKAVQNVDLNRFGGPVSVRIERVGTLTNTVCWV